MKRLHLALALTLIVVLFSGGAGPVEPPKIDPALRILLEPTPERARDLITASRTPGSRTPLPLLALGAISNDADPTLDVFLESRTGAAPTGAGVNVRQVGENLYAGRVTLDAMRRLAADPGLESARLSRPVKPTLDRSAPYLGLDSVRRLDREHAKFEGLTGGGVVVGIVDTGVDTHHPDFQTAEGKSRVFRLWDQWSPATTGPEGYVFGREYKNTQFDEGIADGIDLAGHGTHVLGIAAGNGRGSISPYTDKPPYAGIAPEATIIAVRSNFTELGVTLGAQYIFDRAGLLGYPTVINLSLGNHFGPHVGNTPFERSLAQLVGPGKLIVAAAGNDGERPIHVEMNLAAGESQEFGIEVPIYHKTNLDFIYMDVEGWFDRSNRYRISVIDPLGNDLGSMELGARARLFDSVKGKVRGWYSEDLGFTTALIEIQDDPESIRLAIGEWKIRVEALTVGDNRNIDFWLVNYNGLADDAAPVLTGPVDHTETVISPSTSPRILSVGAVSTRSCWTNSRHQEQCYADPPAYGEVAFFSARGPTSDGRDKPDVLAPGFGVISALSSSLSPYAFTEEQLASIRTENGLYMMSQGTSMSAPQATGTVALLLQKYPKMTFDQMVGRLRAWAVDTPDWRTGKPAKVLRAGNALLPVAELTLAELIPEPRGNRVRWYLGKTRTPVTFRVYRGFSEEGPFHQLSSARIVGDNPYEILDSATEPGRRHIYKIEAVDVFGLEDEMETVSTEVSGTPRMVFRAPDPNPVRSQLNLRFFLPPSPEGGTFELEAIDVQGRRVARIDQGSFGPDGLERLSVWNLNNARGARVAGGIYLVRLTWDARGADSGVEVRRAVVLP